MVFNPKNHPVDQSTGIFGSFVVFSILFSILLNSSDFFAKLNLSQMELVLDLHLHSRFSRAVSQKMNLPNMSAWAKRKGLNVLTVADFTHPVWFKEISSQLVQVDDGLYSWKNEPDKSLNSPRFIFTTEVASIYTEKGIVHKIHNLILAPSLETAEKINSMLRARGFNLSSDGRPILGISSRNLLELLLAVDKNISLIPCHVWTPWFSLYGSRSGYDSITDCFGDYAKYIFAIETGLSSDPSMNWRIDELGSRSIVSFSDAHSLEKMGREATVLTLRQNEIQNPPRDSLRTYSGQAESTIQNFSYRDIIAALKNEPAAKFKIAYTIEFYPEEGKYHYTGHRNCNISYSPTDVKNKGKICPVCHRELTVGVLNRVEDLAGASSDNFTTVTNKNGVTWIKDAFAKRPPYVSLVPLLEVIAETIGNGVSANSVVSLYDKLISQIGTEHDILLRAKAEEIAKVASEKLAQAILKVRSRNIYVEPGFDGEYGKVKIWDGGMVKEEKKEEKIDNTQMGLF